MMGKALMSAASEQSIAVNAERSKIKIGYPCKNQTSFPLIGEIFGPLESISTEYVWNQHRRFPDTIVQHQTLQRKYINPE